LLVTLSRTNGKRNNIDRVLPLNKMSAALMPTFINHDAPASPFPLAEKNKGNRQMRKKETHGSRNQALQRTIHTALTRISSTCKYNWIQARTNKI